MYGYWTHCLYSCEPSVYDSYIKQNKQLPTVKLDQFFNPINVNNDSDMEVNSPNVNENNNDKSNRKSIRINANGSTNIESKTGANSNESNGDFSCNEFLKSNLQCEKEKSLADETEQRLKINSSFNLKSSSKNSEEFEEIWLAVPRPNYGADVWAILIYKYLKNIFINIAYFLT